jgi:ribosomal protein L37AE/L43A
MRRMIGMAKNVEEWVQVGATSEFVCPACGVKGRVRATTKRRRCTKCGAAFRRDV